MKAPTITIAAVALAMRAAVAYPGIKDTIDQINSRAAASPPNASPELIGDLEHLSESSLTPTGSAIKRILLGQLNPQDLVSTYTPPPRDSSACAADTCCIWKYIAEDLHAAMVGTAGRCNKLARGAVRLGFHDAGGWSRSTGPGGGADGSILLANECEERRENGGLLPICAQMRTWWASYKPYGISLADLVQFAAAVGAVACPQGPRVRSFVGRRDSAAPAPRGNLPSPFASADALLRLFADKTLGARDLVALLGAHTASRQITVDRNRTGAPQDTTPGVWDAAFFRETAAATAPAQVVRFPSDTNLAADPRTAGWFGVYGRALGPAQALWNDDYARAYVRLSLLGVANVNDLTECTHALPPATGPGFASPDAEQMARFARGELAGAAVDAALEEGDLLPQ
ncbi:ligninase H2 precursor [Cordyceps fumosorosea ARSEF 2679]|uniref:Peroxidase n=1 Tax=Cordyceps fumosorosea (strain ARSEF 2679) TaxID=1081104 RepID=A0A167TP45_CORFA|nr:ligninase H2 precursor [Cordyceps fumosorosea ARSEF 2679]OAA60800.1 ligninase H2 precursor [Cordyceps fumosorosea ARSEF 2679]